MPRTVALFAIVATLAFLLSAQRAAAQCAKQLLVYLDSSGSMGPNAANKSSPYNQTITALDNLLADHSVIEAGDEGRFTHFGEDVEAVGSAVGPEMRSLLRSLQQIRNAAVTTNFKPVFADVAIQLGAPTSFKRQLVVIASDFAHDPRGLGKKRSNSSRVADWRTGLPDVRDNLERLFPKEGNRALVLLLAPAQGDDLLVRQQVLHDLEGLRANLFEYAVGPGGTPPDTIARELAGHLLSDPAVTVVPPRTGGDAAIVIANPNCRALTLTEVSMSCAGVSRSKSNFRVPVPREQRILPAGASQTLSIPASALANCGGEAPNLEASVQTAERRSGPALGSADSRRAQITFNPKTVLAEWNLFRQHLHVCLDLSGYLPSNHHLSVSLLEDGKPLTSGRFLPETQLKFGAPQLYRADLSAGWMPHFDSQWNLAVTMGEDSAESSKNVAFASWEQATLWNCLGTIALYSLLVFYLFHYIRHGRPPGAGQSDLLFRLLIRVVGPITVCSLPLIASYLLPGNRLLQRSWYLVTPILTGVAIGFFTTLVRDAVLTRRLDKRSLRRTTLDRADKLPLDELKQRYAELRRISAQRDSAPLWGICIAMLTIALAVGLLHSGPPQLTPDCLNAEPLGRLAD